MKVYVVLEDDRGCGPMIIGVFASKSKAEMVASESSHYWVSEQDFDESGE